MGGDYLSASIYLDSTGIFYKMNTKNAEANKLAIVAAVAEMGLSETCEVYGGRKVEKLFENDDNEYLLNYYDVWVDEMTGTGHRADDDLYEKILADDVALAEFIAEFVCSLDDVDNRESMVTDTAVPGVVEVSTGGMSWGDSPTETFDDILRLFSLPDCVQKYLGIYTTLPTDRKQNLSVSLSPKQLEALQAGEFGMLTLDAFTVEGTPVNVTVTVA